ncbi:MAG: hypothetical protein R3B47_05270 [Bacteroidia bacterium]
MENNAFPHQDINMVENHFTVTDGFGRKRRRRHSLAAGGRRGGISDLQSVFQAWCDQHHKHPFDGTERPYADRDFSSYLITAVDAKGYEGFACEPVVFAKNTQLIEIEDITAKSALPYSNYSGNGFVEISLDKNREISFSVTVEDDGEYLIDFRYANGSGPWNTDNKCAIRSLTVNGNYEGVIVLPQRGKDEWSDWGFFQYAKGFAEKGATA